MGRRMLELKRPPEICVRAVDSRGPSWTFFVRPKQTQRERPPAINDKLGCGTRGHRNIRSTRQRIFAFLVLGHKRRGWSAHQITEAFPWDMSPKYLARDNERASGCVSRLAFERWVSRAGRRHFARLWQNGHVERLIGSAFGAYFEIRPLL
jgi:hypothetical protein